MVLEILWLTPKFVLELCQGVHTSWKTWKSWKRPGIFFCPGICPGIYYFQNFVLEISWNFFVQFTNFFSQSLFLYFAFSNFILYFLSLCILTTSHAIINFFSFSKNNVAKRNCTFFNHWLIEFEWVEKGPSARTAYCQLYHHTFDISNMRRSTVISHSEGKKHKDKEISRKLLPISFFAKKSDVLSLTVSDLDQGQCPSAPSSLQMCSIGSSVPCLIFS